jgi:hypothetical protein
MATTAEQLAADDAAVEAIRQRFGDAEAAKLAADLYKLRRTPAPSTFAGFPRWAVVGIALWLAVLETADKLPQVLLAYPRYEAALADVKTKLMQPDIAKSQLDLNRQQIELAKLQTQKTWTETQAVKTQAFSAAASAYQNWGQAISNGNLSSSWNAQVFAHLDDLQPLDFTPYVPPPPPDPPAASSSSPASNALPAPAEVPPPEQGASPAPQPPAASAVPTTAPVQPLSPPPAAAPSDTPSAPLPVLPRPDQSTEPPKSQAYQDGARDRNELEGWFASLSGDEHDGAEYWASVRSVKGEHKCTDGKGATSVDFQKGCEESWQKLIPIDARRKAEPDYKDGFNSR